MPLLPEVLPQGSEVLNQIDYTPERIVDRPEAIRHVAPGGMRNSLVFTLHDDNVGMLPASNTDSLATLADLMGKAGWSGFMTRYWQLGDHDPCVAFLARRSWDDAATPEQVYRDQFQAICGPAAGDDLMAMFRELETVTRAMNQHAMFMAAAVPNSSIEYKHWDPDPLPAPFVADQQHYRQALEWARKAQEKSLERGKACTAYWIGRLEFGVGYFECAAAARQLPAPGPNWRRPNNRAMRIRSLKRGGRRGPKQTPPCRRRVMPWKLMPAWLAIPPTAAPSP